MNRQVEERSASALLPTIEICKSVSISPINTTIHPTNLTCGADIQQYDARQLIRKMMVATYPQNIKIKKLAEHPPVITSQHSEI